MSSFGRWTYTADREATLLGYQSERGGADRCGCIHCRNFVLARARVFPAQFLALLDELGIDPSKDAEVYHTGRLAAGRHDYGGWYHFVGTLDTNGDFPLVKLREGFSACLCTASAPRLASFKGIPVVQLEFHTDGVPWLLDEPEPD